MGTTHKRATIIPDHDALAVLGVEADTAGINGSLSRYAGLIERAAAELTAVLERAEWNYLADCLNGCADLWMDTPIHTLTLIGAEAEDAHRLNRTGDKWLTSAGDRLAKPAERKAADAKVAEMLAKLQSLTALHGEAIMAAVRHFWSEDGVESIDHTKDEWWTVKFRREARKAAVPKDE